MIPPSTSPSPPSSSAKACGSGTPARGEAPPASDDRQRQQFIELVLASRERLKQLYASDLPEQAMRAAKQAEFERLRHDYRAIRQQWGGQGRYDAWIEAR